MKTKYFVKLYEDSVEFKELIRRRPTSFVLLALIATRARKVSSDIPDATKIGEAFIGDYKEYGATLQSYRTDKKYLEKFKIVTFKTTNRGTVAKIVDTSIFDISRVSPTSELTDQQQSNNIRLTTKQEVRGEKEEDEQSHAKPMEKKNFFHEIAVVSEDYWDKCAPAIAKSMDIDVYSDRYVDARADWLMKADRANPSSIRSFLKFSNYGDQGEKY